MSNRLSKKRRLARARAHQAKTRNTPPYSGLSLMEKENEALGFPARPIKGMRGGEVTFFDDPVPTKEEVAENLTKLQAEVNGVPSRAKCPECGFRQKVRKNGLMSRHDVFLGSEPQECKGTGARWNA